MKFPKTFTDDQRIAVSVALLAVPPAECKQKYHRLYRPNSKGWFNLTRAGRTARAMLTIEQMDECFELNNYFR